MRHPRAALVLDPIQQLNEMGAPDAVDLACPQLGVDQPFKSLDALADAAELSPLALEVGLGYRAERVARGRGSSTLVGERIAASGNIALQNLGLLASRREAQ